jgi:hypothetical protein
LLLAGVTLNSFFSALILFVQFLSDFTQTFRTVRWLMGDLDVSSYAPLVAAAPPIALSFGAFAMLPRSMNLLSDQRRKRSEPWRRRAPHAAPGILERVAGNGRCCFTWRAGGIHRHRRSTSRPVVGGSRSPHGTAGLGLWWRRLSGRVRHCVS